MYLIKLFENSHSIAFVSRGYKRKSKGLFEADSSSPWFQVGDEPFLVKKRFPKSTVIVDHNRRRAYQNLSQREPKIELLIFDDVFQHLKIKTGFQILLSEYSKLFYKDFLLPCGYLRESRGNAKYCDAIIITKCPSTLSPLERRHVDQEIRKYSDAKVYFSYLSYLPLVSLIDYLHPGQENDKHLMLSNEFTTLGVCGIANPFSFEEYLRRNSQFSSLLSFPDHHQFSLADLEQIKGTFQRIKSENKIIVLTEKDAVKFSEASIIDEVKKLPMFVLPIEVKFNGTDQTEFEKNIQNYVRENKRIG